LEKEEIALELTKLIPFEKLRNIEDGCEAYSKTIVEAYNNILSSIVIPEINVNLKTIH